jgi:RNA polymerase sigma factor (sigma-70 family)
LERIGWEQRCEDERARLVHLCSQITGHAGVAEDLTQETLAEAWRLRDRLTDPAGYDRWLSAIARNVCLRWMRSYGRERARQLAVNGEVPDVSDGWDLEVELEQSELATMLDRALSLLSADTRAALVAQYIEELPQSEIAARLGISQGAVAMRIQRGRLALRRLLTTELRDEARSFGLVGDTAEWQETRIWCPFCGIARLHGSFAPGDHLHLRCPHCCAVHAPGFNVCCTNPTNASRDDLQSLLGDIKGYRPALNRVMTHVLERYRSGLGRGVMACARCGEENRLRSGSLEDQPPSLAGEPNIYARCKRCGAVLSEALKHLVLQLPEARGFWRAHPRMRVLPYRQVEHEGMDAWVTTFESVADGARLEVVSSAATLERLALSQ